MADRPRLIGRYHEAGLVRADSQPPRGPSVPFDPQRRVRGSEFKASTARIIASLEAAERQLGTRQRRRGLGDLAKFRLAAECMVANLASVVLLGSHVALAVPRGSGVMWGPGRYASPVYGQHFLDVLALMAHPSVALLEDVARGFSMPGGYKAPSIVRPTEAFRHAACGPSLGWEVLGRDTAGEVIILRSGKHQKTGASTALHYADNPHTRRMRKEIRAINVLLQAAPVMLLPAAGPDSAPADPLCRSVVRIFNGCWSRGGRLYGAFWETMGRRERFDRIRIKGERIANVDFAQLFACLAYRRCHLPIPEGDLYDVAGDGSCRPGWKALVNALLFTTGEFTH